MGVSMSDLECKVVHTHASFSAAHDQDILPRKLGAAFVLRRVKGFSLEMLNTWYERYIGLYVQTWVGQ